MSKTWLQNETPHVGILRVRGYDEFKVYYRGLKPDRLEAMAYYTDDREDAEGTARHMERTRDSAVFNDDIAPQGRVHWPERFKPASLKESEDRYNGTLPLIR